MLLLKQAGFIDTVFMTCVAFAVGDEAITADRIRDRLFPAGLEGEDLFYSNQDVGNGLQIMQAMKLLTSELRPEFTRNLRLSVPRRYGKLTWLGKAAGYLPDFASRIAFMAFLQRARVTACLGAIAFAKMLVNAYQGVKIFAGWAEYAAAAMICYVLYLAIMRLVRP